MTPTMKLRWLETKNYNPQLDEFDKILQQCFINESGNEVWLDIETWVEKKITDPITGLTFSTLPSKSITEEYPKPKRIIL